MNKWWIGACALVVLGCRTEEQDRALGTERPPPEGRADEAPLVAPPAQQQAEPPAPAARPGEEPGGTQRPGDLASPRASNEKSATERLLVDLVQMSQAEVDSSKLAEQRSTTPEVKTLATKLIADHQKDIDSIRKLAAEKGLDLQRAADDDPVSRAKKQANEARLQNLRKLKGEQFDMAYLGPKQSEHVVLMKLADEGQRISNDEDIDALFKTLGGQAHDHMSAIDRALPTACGPQGGTPPATGDAPKSPGRSQPPAGGTHEGHQGDQPSNPKP